MYIYMIIYGVCIGLYRYIYIYGVCICIYIHIYGVYRYKQTFGVFV